MHIDKGLYHSAIGHYGQAGHRRNFGAMGMTMAMDDAPRPDDLPDLAGVYYQKILTRLHDVLTPRNYLEIGTLHGETLALARCDSIAIDPEFRIEDPSVIRRLTDRPALHMYSMTSDAFFARHDPRAIFGGPIDLAFLDGMHRCEFLLRDFIAVERHCKPNSVIILHDCLPVEAAMTGRTTFAESIHAHRHGWWTGDVWRTALLLKRTRCDLAMTIVDAAPTGLVIITNLDPASCGLINGYRDHVAEMMRWELHEIGISALFHELGVQSTDVLSLDEAITQRFWL